jgi:uncharacterized protein YjbI with pentapeptide repeats
MTPGSQKTRILLLSRHRAASSSRHMRTSLRALVCCGLAIALVGLGLCSAVLGSNPAAADTIVGGCTIVSNPTPSHFTSCPGTDLSHADLSGADLSYANFSGDTFATCPNGESGQCFGVNLSDTDLHDANLSNVVFEVTYFLGGPLPHTNGADANLSDADLADVNASGATLDWMPLAEVNVNLTGANFSHASIAGASLRGAALTNINLSEADLSESDLTDATFSGTDLSGANLSGVGFTGTALIPASQTADATSGSGAVVSWPTPPALPGATPGSCSPASGSTFAVGTTQVTCAVVDDSGNKGFGGFEVQVAAAPPMTFTTTSLPAATIGAHYSATLSVGGGYAPYSFKLVPGSGKPPRGLKLDKSTGTISGTPTKKSSTTSFTVKALDTKTPRSKGHPATQNTIESTFNISVSP